ncbi:MAG: MarR family transcriptional regulator [Clostridiales bacterium]|nr:MarR family transcriptional regulator [Clostridiales bacterium]
MLDYELHFLLLKCFHYSQKIIVRQTAQLGLYPGQPKILECLYEKDGQTPKSIGKKCVIDKSTMTSLLKKMEAMNLIYKKEHEDDKRSVEFFLTEHGRLQAEKVKKICTYADEDAFKNFSENQKNELIKYLKNLLSNFEVNYDD